MGLRAAEEQTRLGLAHAIRYALRRSRLSPLMRIRISHLTSYRYKTPATSVIQMLRLTPRNHDGQYVARWRIDVSTDCQLDQHEDAFGNITHVFTAEVHSASLP
jgi:transglutaminase-like putative cysteine protease